MDQVQVLAQIRSIIQEKLNRLGSLADTVPGEAILIRDGFFCGRRFYSDGLEAVWFIEENQIKFYERDGGILEVLEITPESLRAANPLRKAA